MPSSGNVIAHFAYALQLSLGIVFFVSAVPKLRRPSTFAATVAAYRIVPARFVPVAALALVAVESFLASSFLSGWLLGVAFPLAAATLMAFFVAVALNLRRGLTVRCGCFGVAGEQISGRSLVRLSSLLLGLLALVLALRWSGTPNVTLGSLSGRGAAALVYVLEIGSVAAFVVVIGQWVLHVREVASILRHGAKQARALTVPQAAEVPK